MVIPQEDMSIEVVKRLDALLEYAVMHEDHSRRARGERPRRSRRLRPQARHTRTRNRRPSLQAVC